LLTVQHVLNFIIHATVVAILYYIVTSMSAVQGRVFLEYLYIIFAKIS